MRFLPLIFLGFATRLHAQEIEAPKAADESLEVTLFAAEPMIQQPIGCTFDQHGRLLVIESQTHFRPKDWKGPEHDQIVLLTDTDGDGRADKRAVFFDQTDLTMDIATHPDGAIYLSTRNEILRLRDDDGDGKPEKVERRLVWMESESRYPHNGLSGLAFDAKGDLYFGMGENLGAAYTLTGSDDSSESDGGEGGNVWHVTKDGARLKRIATGFWNPFGVCVDPWGHVFATDNDPDSSPPCRLHHIIPGGDYGYQFRYGRTGLHPFISWNGQRLGTLPMLAGTGEAPCDVIFYEGSPHKAYRGLSAPWAGSLLVASWVDHRIESHTLKPAKGSFTSTMKPLITGGTDFKPVAMAVAADGSLFITDWVKRDYELHGKGRVWRVRSKVARPLDASIAQPLAVDADSTLRERIESGPSPSGQEALSWLADTRPYVYAAAIERLSKEPELTRDLGFQTWPDIHQQAGVLLATWRALKRQGNPVDELESAASALLLRCLQDVNPEVVLVALHWISDERVKHFKKFVESRLDSPDLTSEIFYAVITTLVRLESTSATEEDLVKRLKDILTDPKTDVRRARLAVQALPGVDRFLKPAEVHELILKASPEGAVWFTHLLGLMRDPARQPLLRELFTDIKQSPEVRAAALLHLEVTIADSSLVIEALKSDNETLRRAALAAYSAANVPASFRDALGTQKTEMMEAKVQRLKGQPFFHEARPSFSDIKGWKTLLAIVPGAASAEHGREVFLSPKLGGCASCHRREGLGSPTGPNLTSIRDSQAPDYALTSLLQPNANVSPQFESYSITTADGQSRTAFQLNERGSTHTYIDLTGKTFDVDIKDIVNRLHLPVSIMPEGIVSRLTDAEVRDLMAYLGVF
jgi:putative membrane-bound dehydrogenase-like protein